MINGMFAEYTFYFSLKNLLVTCIKKGGLHNKTVLGNIISKSLVYTTGEKFMVNQFSEVFTYC